MFLDRLFSNDVNRKDGIRPALFAQKVNSFDFLPINFYEVSALARFWIVICALSYEIRLWC